jgi:nitrile hydratase subunit beta
VNGVYDLGGMMGFGPVHPEPENVRFHAEWERRALALVIATAAMGRWTIDAARYARESLPPVQYLTSSYYEILTRGLETLLVDAGPGRMSRVPWNFGGGPSIIRRPGPAHHGRWYRQVG